MRTFLQDLRYGARMLLKKPGFTLIAVLTLALGIGVNTALFTVFDAFALKPLPLKDPDRIVKISGRMRDGDRNGLFSYLEYLDYRDRNQVFEGLVASNKALGVLGEKPAGPDDDSSVTAFSHEYIFGQLVSGNYFSVLGAEMALGRGFLPEEDLTLGTHPVMVLSYGFWQRRFNADAEIIGKSIKLSGQSYTVIGVTAREFIGTEPDAPQFWVPLMMRDQVLQAGRWLHKRWLTDRNADGFVLTGRLKPGVSLEQAQVEMNVIAQQLAQAYPDRNRKTQIKLASGAAFIEINEYMPLVVPLLVAVGLILMIACANVANLLLARAATRQKEIAVRLAMGASRWRLIRQLLTESLLLSALGGLAGLLITMWTLSVLYPVVMARLPVPRALIESFALNLDPDYRVFGFALLASVVAGVAAGLAPALQASRPNLTSALKDEGSTFGSHLSQSRLRNGLIVAQIAVCLSLLVGAGLLVRNLQKVQTIDTGLETANVFTILAGLQSPQKDAAKDSEVRRRLAARLRALPGVKAVSQAERQPLSGRPYSTRITLPGQAQQNDRPLQASYNFVSPEYFETVRIRLTRGRFFTEQEAIAQAPVVVVSESTARRLWPDEEAIGKLIGIAAALPANADSTNANDAPLPQFEVIGIARDTRSGWVWEKDRTFLYVPLYRSLQQRTGDYVLVRTEGDPRRVMAAVRDEAAAVDPNLSVMLHRVNDSVAMQMAPFQALAQLSGVLGLLALLVASVGLYGVMSFVVTQRTHEIGVRVALGARGTDVIRLFLKQGLKLISIGILLGLLGGAAISRLLIAVLIDLSPFDPLAFGGVAVLLTLVALLACWVPARRATKVDPMIALRYE
jgi:putative ABC transport system permease protein